MQPPSRDQVAAARRSDVQLDHLRPGALADVFHLHLDREPAPPAELGRTGAYGAEPHGRVGQPVHEREAHRQLARLVPAVPDQDALAISHLAGLAREPAEGRRMLDALGEGHREPTTGLGVPHQHVYQAIGQLLATEPTLQEGGCPARERDGDRRARVQHHHCPGVGLQDSLDQLLLLPRQVHARAVVTLALPIIIGAHDDDGRIALTGGPGRFLHACPRCGGRSGWRGGPILSLRQFAPRHGKDLNGGPQSAAQGFDLVMGTDPGAAASHDGQPLGAGADHRHFPQTAQVEGQEAVVLEQHHRLDGRPASHQPVFGMVPWPFGALRGVAQGAEPIERSEDPERLLIDSMLLSPPLPHGTRQHRAEGAPGTWHFDVEARFRGLFGPRRCPPVGHDYPVETPLPPQDHREEVGVVGQVAAVQTVVARHHRLNMAFPHRELEWQEVKLPQGPLVDFGRAHATFVLGFVADEVLDRGHDTLSLGAGYVSNRQLPAQIGVLGKTLEVAAPKRVAVKVHGWGQQYARLFFPRLARHGSAGLLDHRRVPRRPQGRATRDANRRGRAQVVGASGAPSPIGPVGHFDRRHPETFDCDGVPIVKASRQSGLLVQRHGRDQSLDVVPFAAHFRVVRPRHAFPRS